jgi:hypothetical protein
MSQILTATRKCFDLELELPEPVHHADLVALAVATARTKNRQP